ncbi:peripheral-type benzodiazepine receptor-associated protein 1-like isoform X2 [Acanthaster planci]|uniref:Peripheral-type benzodiazepine receptor-associated protein 1-like isoform X2 n=1 Tax=Acanthaster planci TaxID=133434 RepID=A0A8B7Z8K4_ACAPL|nr:peripheral-type benzodiazepine receptor-associated protein 1-like isoform X2 [Acanthaster planci]
MSSGDGPVMGKPPIGTPGSRNKTPSTTPRSSGSTPRQTSASAGRTSNGRPAVPGQVTKSARPNSVTKDTEATLRRKIERLKSELDSRTSKPTSKPGHLKSAGDTKSVSANRASSTALVRSTRNSKNSLSKSLSFEGPASGSKDSTKVQTPPNSQPKASTARRSGGGLPEARLAKTLPGSITDSIGDGKGGKPAPAPVPRGLPRSNSKPDLKKGTSSISDPPKSSSSVSELPDSPASSQGTSLKRTNTYLVKKGQPSASTRVPVIHALPKAENAKTAVVENTSPWLRRNEGDTVCTSEDPKGEPPPCLNKGSNDRRIPKAAASISESSSVSDGIEVYGKMNPDYEHREKTVSNDKVDVTDQPEDLSSIGEGPAPEIKEGSDILQTEAHIKRETGFNVEAGRTLQEEEEPLQHAERKEEDNFMAELKKSPNSQVDDQQTQVETTRSKGGKEELEHLVARQQQEITTLRKENEHLLDPDEQFALSLAPCVAGASATACVTPRGIAPPLSLPESPDAPDSAQLQLGAGGRAPMFVAGSISHLTTVGEDQDIADTPPPASPPDTADFHMSVLGSNTGNKEPPAPAFVEGSITACEILIDDECSIGNVQNTTVAYDSRKFASQPPQVTFNVPIETVINPGETIPSLAHDSVMVSAPRLEPIDFQTDVDDTTFKPLNSDMSNLGVNMPPPLSFQDSGEVAVSPQFDELVENAQLPLSIAFEGSAVEFCTPSDAPLKSASSSDLNGGGPELCKYPVENLAADELDLSKVLLTGQSEIAPLSAPVLGTVSLTVSDQSECESEHSTAQQEEMPSHRGNLKRAPTSALGSAAQSVIGSGTGTGDGMDERSRLHGGPALSRDAPREHRTRQQVEELQMERKPTEERIDKLKKRNIELSVMAKRLEEKAKQIQKQKKGDTSPTPSNGSPSPLQQTSPTAKPTEAADFYKRLLAKQRAHYLAENAQKLLAKDKEIRGLRQELDRQRPGVSPEPGLEQNSLINAEKMHLEQIIKGNAKEQLRLQRQIQLASSAPDAQTNGLGNIRYQTIEDANRALRIKCAKLEKFREENTLSEVEVTQQRLACENLEKALSEERRKCTDVSTDYQNALIQNTALARKNAELQEKINLLEHVNRECQKLRVEVNEQRQLFENTALERDILHEKVEKLERDLSLMQDAEEKRRALEQEYEQAIRELREKQEEIRRLQQEQQVAKRDHHDSVSRLAAKVKDLERKCDEQSSNFSRLSNELLALRNEAGSQLFTMTGAGAATAGPADSTAQPVVGGVGVAPSRKGTGDKEDWRKIAEEAVVTRASATSVQASQRLPSEQRIRSNLSKGGLPGRDESEPTLEKRTSYPASGDTVSRKSDHSRGIENGQLDTSDAEDLMEDLSDRIDAAILNRLNQASSITTMGPISKLAVFIARYNYDPYRDSPNDNPDAELPLTAGDYIYVYGDPDEDGFYDGELMNGQRGLVPSNFIERVAEEDIPGFMNNNGMDSDASKLDSTGSSVKYSLEGALSAPPKPSHEALLSDPPLAVAGSSSAAAVGGVGAPDLGILKGKDDMKDLDFNSEEEDLNRGNLNHFAGELQSFSRSSEHHSDLEDIPEVDEDNGVKGQSRALASEEGLTSLSDIAADYVFDVPCPKKLTLERQLKNSIIISWLLPDTIAPADVQEYCVYVNGQFRTATKWDAKTRALVENIKPLETYRISVRTVTSKGTSEDAACTIMIGKDAWAAPTDLKASNVSPTSADISWLPGNSNLAHQITVNGKEVQTVKPSVYRYTLTGLSPLSVYRISVKAKSRKTSQDVKEKLATEIEFKTLPGGLPDAPLDVQVKAGASPAICVVEWLPVTITTSGLSNGAVVTGYAVYAEDTKVAEIHSPTADKVSVSLNKLKLLAARDVVVRTLSPNGFSIDSVPARIPPVLLEERRGEATLRAMEAKLSPRRNSHGGHRLTNYRRKSRRRYSHPSTMYHGAEEEDSSTHSSRSEDLHHAHDSGTTLTNTKPPAAASSGKAVENATGKEDLVKKADARVPREDYTSESERSELSDIAEEAEEELSDFADGSLPGLSDESEAKALKKMKRREDEQKKVQETLKYNAKPDIELDTDPELESLNKSDKCRPIQVIRQQCDFDREAEQSPHNQVLEPVPIKQTSQPGQAVPHIEITQDEARKAAASEKRSEPTGQPSLPQQPLAAPDPKSRPSTEQPPRPSSPRKSSLGEDLQPAGLMKPSTYKDYDAKSNNDRQRKLSMDSRTDETGTYEDEEDYSVSEGPEELFDDSVIRFFVALYDYDPTAMSPNVDAVDEELTFKEGDIIKVFGDKDADGFYMGELNSQRGYVPYNMVEEVEGPEQTPLNPPKRASTATSGDSPDRVGYTSSLNTTTSSPAVQLLHSPINSFRIPPDARPQKMRALFDYNPQELSPNPDAEAELYFHQGDIIVVFGEMDNDGFYLGELHGQRGLVPSNFLEAIGDTPRPESVPSPQPYSTPTHQPYSPSHQAYSPSPSRESRGSRGSRGSYSSVRSDDRQTQLQHTRHQENGEAPVKGREVRSNSDVADQSGDSMGTPEHIKKKKGLLSKGKALFKKLGGDSKQKHK